MPFPFQSLSRRQLNAFSRRAHPVPALNHSSDDVHSSLDVDSPHISSVSSDYSGTTDTQHDRIEREAADILRRAEADANRAATSAKKKAKEGSAVAKEKAEEASAVAKEKTREGVAAAKQNPEKTILLGNSVVVGVMAAVLGIGAYRKYSRNELTWGVAGLWAAIVGAVAVGDAVVSRWVYARAE